jgi:hypothetical protein
MVNKLILPLHDPAVRQVVHGVDLLFFHFRLTVNCSSLMWGLTGDTTRLVSAMIGRENVTVHVRRGRGIYWPLSWRNEANAGPL